MKSLLISVDINLDSMFLYKCGTFYIDAEKNCSWIYLLVNGTAVIFLPNYTQCNLNVSFIMISINFCFTIEIFQIHSGLV